MKRLNKNMIEGPLFANILLYTVPIILTSLLQLLFHSADLIVVGRFCGSVSVAAVGATSSLTNLMVNLFIGLSTGSSVLVAHALGSHNAYSVHKAVHTALPTALISGLILTLAGIFLSKPLLQFMSTPENVLPLSTLYMQIYFGGMVFNMVYNFSASILRAAGDTKTPLISLTVAGVLNVGLNIIFVTVFHMDVAGVALATTISQAVSAVLVVRTLMRRTDSCKLDLRKMRIYKPELMKLLRIGIPSGIQASLFSISNVTIQSAINSFGDVVMSGNAAASNIESFVYAFMNAFYHTVLNFTGQNAGAGKYKRIVKIMGICMLCTFISGFVLGYLVIAFGSQLLSIYITDSPEAIQYGLIRCSIICSTYFMCGLMDLPCGALRGLGVSQAPMWASIFGVCCVRISWVLLLFPLPAFHSIQSVYLSFPISWTLTFLIQMCMLIIVYRKRLRQNQQSPIHTDG